MAKLIIFFLALLLLQLLSYTNYFVNSAIIDQNIIEEGLKSELSFKTIIIDYIKQIVCVFIAQYHYLERSIARLLIQIKNNLTGQAIIFADNKQLDQSLLNIQAELNIKLAQIQKEATIAATKERLFVITGGPETGKLL